MTLKKGKKQFATGDKNSNPGRNQISWLHQSCPIDYFLRKIKVTNLVSGSVWGMGPDHFSFFPRLLVQGHPPDKR